jgi:5-methylcytosine-specific restriction endonuclease McrA
VRSKASYLGIKRDALPWTEAELAVLADTSLSYDEVSARIGRTVATVKSRASLTGVPRRQRAVAGNWSAWELELLADLDLSLAEVMQFTGRTWASVQLKASRSKFRRRAQDPERGSGRKLYGRDWPEVRAEVLERDGYTCQEAGCGLFVPSGRGLHVHHVIPFRLHPVTEARWLLTLCINHHLARPEHWWKKLPAHIEVLLGVDTGGGEPVYEASASS